MQAQDNLPEPNTGDHANKKPLGLYLPRGYIGEVKDQIQSVLV